MEKTLGSYLNKLTDKMGDIFQNTYEDTTSQEDQQLIGYVKDAMKEWNEAEKFFENVSEPDLIDYAIYRIEASKKRYMYLLKKAKEKGIKMDCC